MLRDLLMLPVLALALPSVAGAADATFERTLTVPPSLTLSVYTGSGYIHVYPGPDNQVHIIGRVHASSWFSGDAEDRIRSIVASPPISQMGSSVTIGRSSSLEPDFFHNISIDYEITAPAQSALKAHSGSGSLEIGGILGPVEANSGSGSIHIDNVGGDSHFDTGSGSIRANHVHGAASATTGSGSIELSVTGPGDVMAKTGSGGIEVSGVQGGLRVTAGSGSISAAGSPSREWRLSSGSGSIRLQVAPNARFDLNASTGSGSINVNRPLVMEGAVTHHHVTGTANGGGPTLRASTGSGSITLN